MMLSELAGARMDRKGKLWPLVSVVMPCLNEARYIGPADYLVRLVCGGLRSWFSRRSRRSRVPGAARPLAEVQ